MAELVGNSRSQQVAGGKPSDVLARCWILASAERDRSLNLLGKGAALRLCCAFPRAREGGASASGFDPAAPARSYGDCSARADRNRWQRGGCGGCALWHFRLGDRALIRGRAGAERRAANPGRRVLADVEARRRFLFGTWRSAVAELVGNSRSQQLAAGQPSAVLARCWILASAERDRSLNLLGKGAALRLCCAFPRAREGGASATGFDPAAPARSYGDCSARADRNRWQRGGCGGCALWHFRLGDRALIRGRAGAERRAANPGRRVLADVEARRRFLFGTWRSAVAELVGNSRSQQLAAGQPSAVLARCWILASAERDRSLNLLGKGAALRLCCAFLVRVRAAPLPPVSIRRRRRAAMGTVRREPIETAGRGVAVAGVRSGISGWVIGL